MTTYFYSIAFPRVCVYRKGRSALSVDSLKERFYFIQLNIMTKSQSTDLVANTMDQGNANLFVKRLYGAGMCPELKPGDLLLCRKLKSTEFYMWGNIYLLATEQGIIIGRVSPGNSESTITIVQDNPLYGNFEIPLRCINEAALLIGRVTEYAY